MQERIIDIVICLLEEYQQQLSKENYNQLSEKLISRGYTENEINLAFSWIYNYLQDRSSNMNNELQYSESSNRVLHDLEKMIISADAYSYLLQLRHLGLVTDYDLETILVKALALGTTTISIDDVKYIVASLIFGSDLNTSWDGFFFHEGTNTIH